MSQAAKAQEPSMEEILASIRRIIADDEAGKPAAPEPAAAKALPPHPPEPDLPPTPPEEPAAASPQDIDAMMSRFEPTEESAEEGGDILELTEAMEARPPPRPSSFRTIEPSTDIEFADTPAREAPRAMPPHEPAPHAGLMSDHASAAVNSAFGSLAHTVLVQNARTLDDVVRELLKPMLKGWLDDNLPSIVERLVRAEIERVSRGRN